MDRLRADFDFWGCPPCERQLQLRANRHLHERNEYALLNYSAASRIMRLEA